MIFTLTAFAEMLMSPNNRPDNATAIAAGQLTLSKAQLFIPAYQPDPIRQLELQTKLQSGFTTIRKYIDVDVMLSNETFNAVTSTEVAFSPNLDRIPKALLFGFVYTGDIDSQNGNCHRYFNPDLTSAYVQIGGSQVIPATYLRGETTNKTAYFTELLKVGDMLDPSKAHCLDYESFLRHKFLIPFDLRELPEQVLNDIRSKSSPIRLSCTHGVTANATPIIKDCVISQVAHIKSFVSHLLKEPLKLNFHQMASKYALTCLFNKFYKKYFYFTLK